MIIFWSYFVAILLGIVLLAFLWSKWQYTYWKRKGVIQLEPDLFYGNMKDMVKGRKTFGELYLDVYRRFKSLKVKYGGIYFIYRKAFVPIDPQLIKNIMQKDFEYFSAHSHVLKNPTLFDKSLFHLNSHPWRRTRKLLTPTFTTGKMKMMFETLLAKSSGLKKLAGEVSSSGEAVNIKDILERFTVDVIGSCGFGLECNSLEDSESEFLKKGKEIFTPPVRKINLWRAVLQSITRKRQLKDLSSIENFFRSIVGDTIDYREKNKIYRKDFMHLMIQLKNRGVINDDEDIYNKIVKNTGVTFSADDITAQCLLFFIARFETSATTMTFALLEIAQHKDIQEKIRKEINEVLDKYKNKLNYDAIMEMSYTEQVIQETLRRYPPLPLIPRVCTKDYTIPGTDIVVEKGTQAHIPVWGLHLDPEYFPNPEKFDPDRFSKANKNKIVDFTYLPFGEGPRICLGLRFGLLQSKIGLITLIKNYRITLNEKTPVPVSMRKSAFLNSVDGDVWLNINKIEEK